MTISKNDRRYEYSGGTSALVFAGPKAFNVDHIEVWRVHNVSRDSVRVTDFQVDGVVERAEETTVTLTNPIPAGETLLILRTVPLDQQTDLVNQGAYLPSVVEDGLDYTVQISQQINDRVNRSVRLSDTAVALNTVLKGQPRPGYVIAVDALGANLEFAPMGSGGSGGTTVISAVSSDFDPLLTWDFDTDLQGWAGPGASVFGGYMHMQSQADSPALSFDGAKFRVLKFKVRKTGSEEWTGQVWAKDPTWRLVANIAEPQWDAHGDALVELRNIDWNAGVSQIRIVAGAFAFDWIAIGRTAPVSTSGFISQTNTLIATAVGAEATARLAMGVQFQSDLVKANAAIVDEKTARVNAIAAETSVRQAQNSAFATQLAATNASIVTESSTRASAISAESQARQALEAKVTDPNTGIEKAHAKINAESTARATLSSSMASQYAALTAALQDKASVSALNGVLAMINSGNGEDLAALITAINNLNMAVGSVNGAVTDETSLSYRLGRMEGSAVQIVRVGNKIAGYRTSVDEEVSAMEFIGDSFSFTSDVAGKGKVTLNANGINVKTPNGIDIVSIGIIG